MDDRKRRLITPIAVIAGCVTLLVVLIVLATQTDATDVNPAVGFPIVLVVLAVFAGLTAVIWRAVARKKSSERR